MLIAIEGLIGIGKSTLQQKLLQVYKGIPLIQDFENHPYLTRFYVSPSHYGLTTIMIFLFMGYQQFSDAIFQNQLVISDFSMEKFLAFGKVSLSSDEYENILLPTYYHLNKVTPKPDLLLYLTADLEMVLSRIRKRGRNMEENIQITDMIQINDVYSKIFLNHTQYPIMIIDVNGRDFLKESIHLMELCEHLEDQYPEISQFRLPLNS